MRRRTSRSPPAPEGPPRRVVAFGPGRVNLIGEHTDYNQGLSLPFAIARGVTVSARAVRGEAIVARAIDLGEDDRFALADPPPSTGWRAFVRGVAAELRRAGVPVPAAELEIEGTLPQGAGLASSAALSAALCLALGALAGQPRPDRRSLAVLCSRVENDWVGAPTGLLDQLSVLLAEEDHALLIDFRTLSTLPVPLDLAGWTLATVDSGEAHAHDSSRYAERRRECARAARELGVPTLRVARPEAVEWLPAPLNRRARHVIEENHRVLACVAALRAGDLPRVGRLLDASHASMRDLFEASTPAVERTVDWVRAIGAAGARMVGGGFGGHVLALFPPGASLPRRVIRVSPGEGARLLG